MANRSLGSLTLDLIAQIGGYTGPLSQAEQATANFSANLRKSLAGIAAASAALVTGAGAALSVMVKNSIDVQDELSKASQKVGVSVEDLSKLSYAADLSDVAFENLTGSLAKFNKGIAEAFSTGKGSAADALSDLGLSAVDSAGKLRSTNDLFLDVADRLAQLQDGSLKTSLAMDLFGKSGADLIPLLNSGKAGLEAMATEAEKLGQVLSTDSAKQAEEFNDNLTRLQKTFSGVANAVAMDALPELVKFSEQIKDPAFQEAITAIAKGLVNITSAIAGTVSGFAGFSKFVGEEFAAQINGIANDDIPRLEIRLAELQKALAPQNNGNNILTGVKITDAIKSVEELEKERDAILKNLAAYDKYQEEKAKAANNRPQVSASEADPFELTAEQVKAARELRELRKQQAKEAEANAKQIQKAFADTLANLEREIALYGEVSRVSQLSYETEIGNLSKLSAAQKEELLNRAAILDMREREQTLAASQREVDLAGMGERGQLASAQLEYDIKNGIIQLNKTLNEQDREKLVNDKKMVEQLQAVAQIDSLIKQQQRSIDLGNDASKAAQVEYDIRNDILKVVGGIESEQAKILINQAKLTDSQEKFKDATKLTEDAAERVNEAFANAWLNIEDGFSSLRDNLVNGFKQMLAEMAHQAITQPIALQFKQMLSGGSGNQAGSAAEKATGAVGSSAGYYAAGALVTLAAIDKWNAQQDEKFRKLTAEYKQANQGLSKVLGEGNKKSESIATGIDSLTKTDGDVLDVNNKMLVSLEGIRAGITNVAAGFARTLVGSNNYEAMGITEGSGTSKTLTSALGGLGLNQAVGNLFGDEIGGFITGIIGSTSKAIYSKQKKVIDSGIAIMGTSLADILTGTTIQAFNYADVNTKKKILGVTSSNKTSRSQEDLGAVFEAQITSVFEGAADALRQASSVFGIDFEKYVDDLKVSAQDISLKSLEGEELTKEIEAFFSKTLDDWAGALLGAGNTRILEDFQQVGESAFETMLRLAAETRTFAEYADVLSLNFKAAGVDAVYATQAIAELAGGFDELAGSISVYYDKFFDESEKFIRNQEQITDAFKELGYAVPASREAFKNLVSGIDLATEAGQKQFASLIRLAGVTDEYLDSLEELRKASAGAALSDLTKAVDLQKEAIQKQIDAASNALGSTRAVAASLASALKNMTLESNRNELAVRRAAQAEIVTAAAIARAGGPLPKEGQLDDALAIVARPSQDLYASFEEYARDFYTTTKNIKDLADATGEQQTTQEQNLEVLNAQLTALDEMVKFYKTQIEKLDGIDSSVKTVTDSIRNLTDVLAEAGITGLPPASIPILAYDYETEQSTQSNVVAKNSTGVISASYTELLDKVDILTEQLNASQFAIAKNTNNTAKILARWDADGLPPETEGVSS